MNKATMQLVFGIALAVIFVILVIITIIYAKHNTKSKRDEIIDSAKRLKNPDEDMTVNANRSYWVNKDDLRDAADDISKLRSYHYFDTIDECLGDLIVEMYDCGLVKTEEIFRIAYGDDALTPDSMIYRTDYDEDEESEYPLPPVDENAQRKIYEKWTKYVDALFERIEISTSDHNIATIKDALMVYGRKDISVLLHSPE